MRKIITSLVVACAFVAWPVSAATITLSPTDVAVVKGQTFTVTVNIDPGMDKLYTVKTSVDFPASLLQVSDFELDPAWPLTPPGNVTDNANGALIQTGGFIGGFTTVKKFGTITFTAKESGSATISVKSDAAAYDSKSANKLSGAQGSSMVTIAETPVQPPPETPPELSQTVPQTPTTPAVESTGGSVVLEEEVSAEQEPTGGEAVVVKEEEAPAVQEQIFTRQPVAQRSLLAAVGSAVTFGTDSVVVGIVVSAMLLTLAGYAIYFVRQKARRKQFENLQ